MKISFSPSAQSKTIVLGVFEGKKLSQNIAHKDLIEKAMSVSPFDGKSGQSLVLTALGEFDHVILMGLGKEADLKDQNVIDFGGTIFPILKSLKVKFASILEAKDSAAAKQAFGLLLRSWQFDIYKTKKRESIDLHLANVDFVSSNVASSEAAFKDLSAVADGVFLTRYVVSEPANIIYPETLAACIKTELEPLGVKVEVLGEAAMTKLGMGALLGVGQGSVRESQLVVMEYKGGGSEVPIAFVGKGVTFDTGGISIKPSDGMEEMIFDMAGAGAVIGVMKALAKRKAKVNVVGVVGLVENMPSGNAQRPGDIVKTMSGQTVEVLNTDAEGRLVLADAVWYTQDRFKPQYMVDLATLTGAVLVALGTEHAGLLSNDDTLSEKLFKAGQDTGEKLWRLPLSDAYDKDIDTDRADVRNIGSGRMAGSINGGQFIQRFVNGTKWAHLDIAGTVWLKKDTALSAKGATAFGVRLLNEFIKGFEGK